MSRKVEWTPERAERILDLARNEEHRLVVRLAEVRRTIRRQENLLEAYQLQQRG